MTIFARIAQMESSRIVGGRAQTQALLRAPDKTGRTDATGISHPSGPRGVGKQYNSRTEMVRLPSGSIVAIPALEPLDLSQARLHKAILFALPFSLFLWCLIGLAVWFIISAIR